MMIMTMIVMYMIMMMMMRWWWPTVRKKIKLSNKTYKINKTFQGAGS